MNSGFKERGYETVDVFSKAEVAKYQTVIADQANERLDLESDKSLHWNVKHGVSLNPDLWSLITHPRVQEAVREILSSTEIRYAENSDIKIWRKQPASGWHRDSVRKEPEGGSMEEDGYGIVRVGCYFQSADFGFMWGGIPGSHRQEHQLSSSEQAVWKDLMPKPPVSIGSRLDHLPAPDGRPWIRTHSPALPEEPPVQPVWIPTKPTECVIFDPRIIHAGGPVNALKVAAFFAFGVDNHHTREHRDYFSPDENPRSQNLKDYLKAHGLQMK